MAKPGPKPKRAANPKWTPELAYACGLMATDGCLYSDSRHMNLTSQDLEQLETFKKCLGLTNKISWKTSGYTGKQGSHVQFGDVTLYKWFISIGIKPRKTKTIGKVAVLDEFFFDYLRGEFDGDGSSHAYWDTRWHSSVSVYINFVCASQIHLEWLASTITRLIGVVGLIRSYGNSVPYLRFPKGQAREIYRAMYYGDDIPFLKRKKDKLDRQWEANEMAKRGVQPRGYVKNSSIIKIA